MCSHAEAQQDAAEAPLMCYKCGMSAASNKPTAATHGHRVPPVSRTSVATAKVLDALDTPKSAKVPLAT